MQPNILARIASPWHFTKAGSIIIASFAYEGEVGRRASEAASLHTSCTIPITILLREESAPAIASDANDTVSIVVIVTASAIYFKRRDPCSLHSFRIGVVVDLCCWADSQQNSQICKAEELHNGSFEELRQPYRKTMDPGCGSSTVAPRHQKICVFKSRSISLQYYFRIRIQNW